MCERYPCPEFYLYRSVYKTDGFPRNECMLTMKSDMSRPFGELLGFVSFPFFKLYNCINLPRGDVRDVQVSVRVT